MLQGLPHFKSTRNLFCLQHLAFLRLTYTAPGVTHRVTRTAQQQTRKQTTFAKMQADAASLFSCSSSTGHMVALRTYSRPAACALCFLP